MHMSKPQPRRSALTGQTVIAPRDNPRTPEQAPASKQKITITLNAHIANAARGAYLSELPYDGPRTWSQWVERALKKETTSVNRRLNHVALPQPPGTLPVGPR